MDGSVKNVVFIKRSILILSLILLSFVAIRCAPRATPSPSVAKPSPVAGATPGATPTPRGPERTDWEKLVAAAEKEGQVTIYSYSMIGDVGQAVTRVFKEKYGISVDIVSGRGGDLSERIQTERRMGQVVADVGNFTQLYSIKDDKGTVSSTEIPVLQEKNVWLVDPRVTDKDAHILAWSLPNNLAYINTKLVKVGEEPKSLRDLTQPKWAGKIVIQDPSVATAPYTYFNTLLQYGFTNPETVRAIGRNNTAFAINTASMVMQVANGTYAINPGAADQLYMPAISQGAPVKAIAFEEGTVVSTNALAAINKSPHPNSAKLFVNWVLSQEGQTTLLKGLYLMSPRNDVPDFRPEAARAPAKRLIALTQENGAKNDQAFAEKSLVKLWKD